MAQDPTLPLRRELVEQLRKAGAIKSVAVARAFSRVPRHLFVPDHPLHLVYADRALVTKTSGGTATSSSSQPGIMAYMLEQLRVQRGMNVLEIGAGTGYNAALLAELTGSSGAVATIDIQADVASRARANLHRAGYDVRVVRGDGARGLRAVAPFDRIIVTAGCWEIPRVWFDQLAPGGVLVLPLRLNLTHVAVAFRRRGDEFVSFAAGPCGFMPMQGRSGRRGRRRLGGRGGAMFVASDHRGKRLQLARLQDLLRTPPRRVGVEGVKAVARYPASADFATFLALHGDALVGLGGASEGAYESGIVDTTKPSLALFMGASGLMPGSPDQRGGLIAYGTDDAPARIGERLRVWGSLGRSATRDLRMRVAWHASADGEMPRPHEDGTYRFRRGRAAFTAWYQQ